MKKLSLGIAITAFIASGAFVLSANAQSPWFLFTYNGYLWQIEKKTTDSGFAYLESCGSLEHPSPESIEMLAKADKKPFIDALGTSDIDLVVESYGYTNVTYNIFSKTIKKSDTAQPLPGHHVCYARISENNPAGPLYAEISDAKGPGSTKLASKSGSDAAPGDGKSVAGRNIKLTRGPSRPDEPSARGDIKAVTDKADAKLDADTKARRAADWAAQLAGPKVREKEGATSLGAPTREAAMLKVAKAFEVQKRLIDLDTANKRRYGKIVETGAADCKQTYSSPVTWVCNIPFTVERAANPQTKGGSIAK